MRRADKMMTAERAMEALAKAFSGRLSTIGADGYPYCLPLLFVIMDGEIFVHNSNANGHLRTNVENDTHVCFEVCAVIRRRFPAGASPARRNAPAGSNRSNHGGNEMVEAFG